MRILQINKFFHFRGGADKYFFDLSDLLSSKGHDLVHFSTRNTKNQQSEFTQYFVDGFTEDDYSTVKLSHKVRAFINGIYSLEAKRRVQQLVHDHPVDIAHAHNIFYQISPSVFVGLRALGIPTVMSLLDSQVVCAAASLYIRGSECQRCRHSFANIMRFRCYHDSLPASVMAFLAKEWHSLMDIWKNVDLFFTASENFKKLLIDWGWDGSKILINPYFDYLVYEEPSYDNQGYTLFVGRMSFEKGVDTLLKAYKEIAYPLVIVGDGPQRSWAEDYVRKHGMEHVRFVGFVSSKEEFVRLLRGCLFVVVPSNWFELFPLIALDAFCLGKPVVASDSGGIPEIVEHAKNGLLFKRWDFVALREHIKHLIGEPSLARHLGEEGRRKALREYTPELHYSRLISGYRSVLGSRIPNSAI